MEGPSQSSKHLPINLRQNALKKCGCRSWNREVMEHIVGGIKVVRRDRGQEESKWSEMNIEESKWWETKTKESKWNWRLGLDRSVKKTGRRDEGQEMGDGK